jgi:arsenate reductase
MITVYGLKNCDTCKKALKWLTDQGVDHEFKDLRKDGFERAQLDAWVAAAGWETLLNRRGTTWRGLDDADKDGVTEAKAADLMAAYPALIKRPVFEIGSGVVVGFKDEQKAALTE